MKQPLTRGAVRRDGYRFWAYEKTKYGLQPKWYSPDAYNKAKLTVSRLRNAWGAANARTHLNRDGKSACGHGTKLAPSPHQVTCCHCKAYAQT